MTPQQESDLRERVSELLLDWHTEGDPKALEAASEEDFSNLILGAHVVADEAGNSLRTWVQSGRRADLSWAEIGKLLGISRQAAQQRFSTEADAVFSREPEFDPLDPERIVRRGITAFNEVEVLREEGAAGRKLVGATWWTLYFEPAEGPIENIRVVSLRGSSLVEEYERAGWTLAFTWFPYRYFTRPQA